jgi:hypothetical protein
MHLLNAAQMKPGRPSAEVLELIEGIESAQLREWVERISDPRHESMNAATNRAVADWIAGLLREWGYHVTIEGRYRNVVARPTFEHGKCIVVGAHYDSVPGSPGADDNGSAVAAMLGCALACSQWDGELPLWFVAFNCEEDALRGSTEFVKSFLPGSGVEVQWAHILEMVGYASHDEGSQKVPPGLPIQLPTRGDFLGLLANDKSKRALVESMHLARTYVPELPLYGLEVMLGLEGILPVLQRSDHAPFWAEGMASVMWTDTSEFRNSHYHKATDIPETLDYEFLTRVTKVLTATVVCQGEEVI